MLASRFASLSTHCWPVDKAAAKELCGDSDSRLFTRWTPYPLSDVSPAEIKRRHQSRFRDLTGMKRGRVTVVGLIEYVEDQRSRWCVRCDCGRYEWRRHSSLKNGINLQKDDCCDHCAGRAEKLKNGVTCLARAGDNPRGIETDWHKKIAMKGSNLMAGDKGEKPNATVSGQPKAGRA